MINLQKIEGFEWDKGNVRKNEKHGVTQSEAEQVFFSNPLLVSVDEQHSIYEERFKAYGKTYAGRQLTVIFTLRFNRTLIRIISARDMHTKERRRYEEET